MKKRHYALATALCVVAGCVALDRWIEATEVPPLHAPTSAIVTDRAGVPLRIFLAEDDRWRLPVSTRTVDAGYLGQLIANEDKRFYHHGGVDLLAMARAARDSALAGHVTSGGSTLTMQTARLLDGGGTGRWATKLRQIRLALALERRLSKQEILEIYLTRAPFGGNIEGVRAASFSYFGKDARRLSPAEAALLVALPQAPEGRRPDREPALALKTRNLILTRSAQRGALDPDLLARERAAEIPRRRQAFPTDAWHLAEAARNADPQTRIHRLEVDAKAQTALAALLAETSPILPPYASAAAIVLDAQTGQTLAQVGAALPGRDQRGGFIDMTRAIRSPGSALKPFVYALAFGEGVAHPETRLIDRPQDFGGYAPANFDGRYRGPVSAREALQLSLNVPAVALLDATGPRRLSRFLEAAGVQIHTPDGSHPGLTAALGGLGLTLKDLVQAYAVLVREGQGVPGHRLLRPEAVWHVTDILRAAPAPRGSRTGEIAFKTGTSYGHRDAWAIGYDGRHVLGIWIGRPDGAAVPGMTGLTTAAPLLFRAFDRVLGTPLPHPGPPPDTLIVEQAELPAPLRNLLSRKLLEAPKTLDLSYPPTGARIEMAPGGGLVAKVGRGQPPYSWLVDGTPVAGPAMTPVLTWVPQGPGFLSITVIDRTGASAASQVELVGN